MTVFVFCGAALAAWAVVLTLLGITRPDFPGGKNGERVVVTISVGLVALTIAAGVVGGALESGEEEGERGAAVAATSA